MILTVRRGDNDEIQSSTFVGRSQRIEVVTDQGCFRLQETEDGRLLVSINACDQLVIEPNGHSRVLLYRSHV